VNASREKKITVFGTLLVLAMGITAVAFAQDQHHAADPHHPVKADSPGSHPDSVPNPGMHDKEHNVTGHEAVHHGPEAINWTDIEDHHRPAYIALVVNFGVLIIGYYLLGKKPVGEALKQRRVTIGKAIEDAQTMLGEAKERAKKYQADLKNADTDAADAKAALIAAGKGEVERMLLDANEKADRMKRDADRLVEQERKQVQHDLLKETIELAVREATKTLEKTVTAEDHARLADDLLKELSAKPAATAGGAA
jgi:F-type H+-transporting ATPase subunit b